MRIAIIVGVVALILGCGRREPQRTGIDPAPLPRISEATAWAQIEELARPRVAPRDHEQLARALEIAARNHEAWRELQFESPAPPSTAYPEGPEAVAALVQWLQRDGGLPPAPRMPGPETMQMHALGRLAISTASDADWTGVAAGAHLGSRMITQGVHLLAPTVGIALLKDAQRKARELGDDAIGVDLPGPGELLRIAAAEASHSRRMEAYLKSPEGKREMTAQLAKVDPGAKQVAEQLIGRKVELPSDGDWAAISGFWLAALEGARPGEPAGTTVARARSSLTTLAGTKMEHTGQMIVSALERLATDLASLSAP
jgi:hypothetical protein